MESYKESEFWQSLIRQVRAIDQWGSWDSWTDEKIINQKYIRSKVEMADVPLVADVDERILINIRLLFQALAQSIEKKTGLMTSAIIDINSEGFGRALIVHRHIVLYEKVYREAHRFHFTSIEKLVEQGDKMLQAAISMSEKMETCLAK